MLRLLQLEAQLPFKQANVYELEEQKGSNQPIVGNRGPSEGEDDFNDGLEDSDDMGDEVM